MKNIKENLDRKIGMQLKKKQQQEIQSMEINQKCLLGNQYVPRTLLSNVKSLEKFRAWYLRTLMPFDFTANPPSLRILIV